MSGKLHAWDVSPKEGIRIQKDLLPGIITGGRPGGIRFIAGVDIAFSRGEAMGYCGIVVFRYPEMEVVEERYLGGTVRFPYVPGLLSFREGPLFLETWELLETKPDLVIFDGQGIAHPRRLGIASHMGLWLGIPTIGCAKSRLFGSFEEPDAARGSTSPLFDGEGRIIGAVLRTRERARPVYVSPGHMVGVDEAVEIIMACTGPYRIPVPTREAHIRVGEYKRSTSGKR